MDDFELNFIELNVKITASGWCELTKQEGGAHNSLISLLLGHVVKDAVGLGKHMLSKYR